MKYLAFASIALFAFMALAPEASAVVCARGVYRAGCVGPRGAAVVGRPAVVYRGGAVYKGGAAAYRGGAVVARRAGVYRGGRGVRVYR
jgi:hypothetical protein